MGHEGEAKGNLVGVGNIVKRWFRSAVEIPHEKITAGLQLFHGHSNTNDHAGRIPIGEVVGKKAMKVGDRLSSVVACYIFPNYRHLPLDVASIEADVSLEQDAKRGFYVADIGQVTGIALGNSAIETPGFSGATLLGQLQAFAGEHGLGDEDRIIGPGTDLTARMKEAVARRLLGDRDSLALRNDFVLTRMASGAIVINGYGFDEMTWKKSNKVMELINEKQQEEAARSPYLDPAKNPMIRLD